MPQLVTGPKMTPTKTGASGFTLIELMVVLAVLAVLLKMAMLSFQGNDNKLITQQVTAFKSMLQKSCQSALFHNKVYALIPDNDGVSSRVLVLGANPSKQKQPQVKKTLKWVETKEQKLLWKIKPAQIETSKPEAGAFNFEQKGWRCWPQGLMDEGQIVFDFAGQTRTLSWNAQGQFSSES
ncbi:MAG: prepilin-type N-terminal cleavage/methylation domain-containing protein [Hydrogenovibrio sp.]|uniref:prepilin-type N-terminal cleavage/methylation domain-containing protein n=1 Tax=Hydrogenovibrio sp. TaxID=2065821 RepID=UPI0028709968|nr:prepilin-type N-terminal cleavage/methylation domain-containing protein [Hydrogenovibrio sp.]MDR9499548.1 prepilin-type N-terminal cleavage/methylation domain-containing protein [Hydrogenovibrio sp.]